MPSEASPEPNEASRKPGKRKRRLPFWIELPILIVIALVVALVVRTYGVQPFYIPSESMENTLLVDDQVLVNKFQHRFTDIQRGEVVVFKAPTDWNAPPAESDLIKRVIGVGGDRVVCCSPAGKVTVNGYELTEPYLYPGNAPSDRRFDVRVPAGRLFMMGDHRANSADSRFHLDTHSGTIPVDNVVGNAFVIYWPVGRWKSLSPGTSFESVPSSAAGK